MRALFLALLAACSIPTKVASNLGDDAPLGQHDAPAGDGPLTDGTVSNDANPQAPVVTLLGQPKALDNQAMVTFTYSVTPGAATIECRIDSDAYATCPASAKSFTVIDGSHTFDLRATYQSVTGAIPQYAFAVDTVKPVITISAKPPANTSSTTAAFTFSTEAGATLACTLDTQLPTACTSSTTMTYATLGDGPHTFLVTATDGAGNQGSASASWTVTTTGPAVTITNMPPALTKMTAAQFDFTVMGATSVTCKIETTAATACTTTAMYSSLPDGQHTFTVVATDAAMNMTTKNYAWTVDTMAPALAITGTPANPTNATGASFVFTNGMDAAMITCSLDGGAAQPCASPWPYTMLADATHTFSVTVTDLAGNSASKAFTWTVDTVPPMISITNNPPALTNSKSATFAYMASVDATTITCQLDGGAIGACPPGLAYANIPDGTHTFTIFATDAAGNTAMQSYTWKIDTVAPAIGLTNPLPSNPTKSTTAVFNFIASDSVGPVSVTCYLDNSPSPCVSGQSFGPLSSASHTFYAVATDGAGNTTQSATFTWLVDAVLPTVTAPAYTCDSGGGLMVTWTESDAGSGIASTSCTYGGVAVGCVVAGGNGSYTGAQKPTGSVFAVTVTDNAGNLRTASRVINVNALICQ